MKILTKEVLTAFIADSNQSYIAGMLSNKIEGVSFYAEFIRKPMIQKKHKVELLYSAVSDVQDGQEEENISLFHDELNFMGYIVDNETFYLFDAKKEDVEQLRLFGFEAGDMPENSFEARFQKAVKESSLPAKPDMQKIEELLVAINKSYLSRTM